MSSVHDERGVDIGENVAHGLIATHGGDHSAFGNAYNQRHVVHQDQRLLGSSFVELIDAFAQPFHLVGIQIDASALQACLGMLGESHFIWSAELGRCIGDLVLVEKTLESIPLCFRICFRYFRSVGEGMPENHSTKFRHDVES